MTENTTVHGIASVPPEILRMIIMRRRIIPVGSQVCKAWRAQITEVLAEYKEYNICWWSGSRAPRSPQLASDQHDLVAAFRDAPASITNLRFDTALLGHSSFAVLDYINIRQILDIPSNRDDSNPGGGYNRIPTGTCTVETHCA